MTFRWPDHEETNVAGDAYRVPPRHLTRITDGTAVVEFSPDRPRHARPPPEWRLD